MSRRARWGIVGTNVGLPIAGAGREVVSGDNPVAANFIVAGRLTLE